MSSDSPTHPDFESDFFLKDHIERTLEFYRLNAFDGNGGFFHCLLDDGRLIDLETRHLVSSTRHVVNFASSHKFSGNSSDRSRAEHGLQYITDSHLQPGGWFAWELRNGAPASQSVSTYGHSFVLLAAATAFNAGIPEGRKLLDQTWEFCEKHLWRESDGAYVDELPSLNQDPLPYRGQNANMHMCEACLAAWHSTRERRYLERAEILATKFALELADACGGQVWEHFTSGWQPDFDYNSGKPDDLFKPWGFQPGHQFEWSRLLLTLEKDSPREWHLDRAVSLYETGMNQGRDSQFGGVVYGVAPDGSFASVQKYYWVHSEGFAAAWRLFKRTGSDRYRSDYNDIWRYSWNHFVDHKHGAWFRVLQRDGSKVDDYKSPPGKTDYHTVMACWDVINHLQ